MPFQLSDPQRQQLKQFVDAKDFAGFYAQVYSILANAPIDSPTAGAVDPFVMKWFNVAQQANSGNGPESDLIRNYTAAQVLLRTGHVVPQTVMQQASDAIAHS